jgi:hypothetical protein
MYKYINTKHTIIMRYLFILVIRIFNDDNIIEIFVLNKQNKPIIIYTNTYECSKIYFKNTFYSI